jgi:pimeloyl-ACP methyl ester carboxylesterase
MKTTDIVEDFELFRQAIGESQVTFYGFSYGTYIAQVWATLHPTSLKALILDGVVDPSRVWYQANLDQDYAFGKTFDKFFAWIGKYHRYFGLGKTRKQVEKRITRLEKQLAKRPADGRLGPSELADAILVAGYINLAWPDVAAAVAELANRDNSKPLQQLYRRQNPTGKGADNGYAMYLATECTDVAWPKDWNIWAADNNAADQASPFFAWANAWFNAPCRNWPVAPSTPVKVSGSSFTGPVLLANETFDAATPFSGALAVRALFPTAVLIEGKGGTSHAVTLSGISCTDNAIAKVLKSGKLPARKAGSGADKKCPGLGAPTLGNQDAHRAPAARVLADALGRAAFLG